MKKNILFIALTGLLLSPSALFSMKSSENFIPKDAWSNIFRFVIDPYDVDPEITPKSAIVCKLALIGYEQYKSLYGTAIFQINNESTKIDLSVNPLLRNNQKARRRLFRKRLRRLSKYKNVYVNIDCNFLCGITDEDINDVITILDENLICMTLMNSSSYSFPRFTEEAFKNIERCKNFHDLMLSNLEMQNLSLVKLPCSLKIVNIDKHNDYNSLRGFVENLPIKIEEITLRDCRFSARTTVIEDRRRTRAPTRIMNLSRLQNLTKLSIVFEDGPEDGYNFNIEGLENLENLNYIRFYEAFLPEKVFKDIFELEKKLNHVLEFNLGDFSHIPNDDLIDRITNKRYFTKMHLITGAKTPCEHNNLYIRFDCYFVYDEVFSDPSYEQFMKEISLDNPPRKPKKD